MFFFIIVLNIVAVIGKKFYLTFEMSVRLWSALPSFEELLLKTAITVSIDYIFEFWQ